MVGVTTRNSTARTSPSFQAEAHPLPPPQCFDTRHRNENPRTLMTPNTHMRTRHSTCPHDALAPTYHVPPHSRLLGPAARAVLLARDSSSSAARAAAAPPLGDPAPQPLVIMFTHRHF